MAHSSLNQFKILSVWSKIPVRKLSKGIPFKMKMEIASFTHRAMVFRNMDFKVFCRNDHETIHVPKYEDDETSAMSGKLRDIFVCHIEPRILGISNEHFN